jgi:hypothetical protein
MPLPFIDPDDDLYINLAFVLIIIECLSLTKRGKLCINNDKLHIFLYLVKNPVVLRQLLDINGKDSLDLDEIESNSLRSISNNFSPLFDKKALMNLLTILIANRTVVVQYKKKEGFFYTLSEKGKRIVLLMKDGQFDNIWKYCKKMTSIQALETSKLNNSLNITMIREKQNEL